MKQNFSILLQFSALLLMTSLVSCSEPISKNDESKIEVSKRSKQERGIKAWEMEKRYWEYVQNIDTVSYKKLWHDDFIGYPSFGDGVSNKSKIAIWIPDLHKDPELKFSYKLYKKGVNAVEDVVIVFYDADEIWTNEENEVVRRETYKFTHTWGETNEGWVILGGMAAKKNQDTLNN